MPLLKAFAASASATVSSSPGASTSASASAASTAAATPTLGFSEPSALPTSAEGIGEALENWMQKTFSLGIWGTVAYAGIVALITFVVIKLMQRTLKKKLYGNLRIFYRLLYVLVIIIAVTAVLLTITPLRDLGNAFLASSGFASVIVGLAAQENLANLFSGISLAVAKPFVVGDYIEIMGTSPPIMGTVVELTLRSTVIRDASNKDIVVPNSVIDHDIIRTAAYHAQTVDGVTHDRKGPSPVTNFLEVGVAYTADVHKAMDIMANLVAEQPQFVDTRTKDDIKNGVPAVTVRVMDLAASSVNLRAYVPTRTISDGYVVLSNLRLLVLDEFDKQGIEIPYPYQNVILQNAYPPQQDTEKNSASEEKHAS